MDAEAIPAGLKVTGKSLSILYCKIFSLFLSSLILNLAFNLDPFCHPGRSAGIQNPGKGRSEYLPAGATVDHYRRNDKKWPVFAKHGC